MSTKLEIPGKTIFVRGDKLGYLEGSVKVLVEEPDVLSVSELREALASRGWLSSDHDVYDPIHQTLKRKIINSSSDIREESVVPVYNDPSKFVAIGGSWSTPDPTNQDEVDRYNAELDEYINLYNKYIMVKEDNIGEYSRLISTRDILGNHSEVCLLCPKDGSYTNIVNINSAMMTSASESPVQLRVGIAYSKGPRFYSRDVIVPTGTTETYITTGQSDFTLEYSEGCLRVFPESQEVTECVISYCFLTYEYLI